MRDERGGRRGAADEVRVQAPLVERESDECDQICDLIAIDEANQVLGDRPGGAEEFCMTAFDEAPRVRFLERSLGLGRGPTLFGIFFITLKLSAFNEKEREKEKSGRGRE